MGEERRGCGRKEGGRRGRGRMRWKEKEGSLERRGEERKKGGGEVGGEK